MSESPEEKLIRIIREMQHHHYEIITRDSRGHTTDDALYLQYHKNIYSILTELIDLYDNEVAEQNKETGSLMI